MNATLVEMGAGGGASRFARESTPLERILSRE